MDSPDIKDLDERRSAGELMKPYYEHAGITIYHGDCREVLKRIDPKSVNCCVTSPPYWGLRDYGIRGQIGLELNPQEYVGQLVEIFSEVHRILRDDGTLWLNLGDSYCSGNRDHYDQVSDNKGARGICNIRPPMPEGLKPKDLVGIPWRVAFALQAYGWYLRSEIIWSKPNPMPESVTDRPTKAHEQLFLLSKSETYHYDAEAIAEETLGIKRPNYDGKRGLLPRGSYQGIDRCGGGQIRNRRSVWTIPTQPFPQAHFATFPEALIEPCIKAGCPSGGTVLDPFGGSGTTALVAMRMGCKSIVIELNSEYCVMAEKRLAQESFDLKAETVEIFPMPIPGEVLETQQLPGVDW